MSTEKLTPMELRKRAEKLCLEFAEEEAAASKIREEELKKESKVTGKEEHATPKTAGDTVKKTHAQELLEHEMKAKKKLAKKNKKEKYFSERMEKCFAEKGYETRMCNMEKDVKQYAEQTGKILDMLEKKKAEV